VHPQSVSGDVQAIFAVYFFHVWHLLEHTLNLRDIVRIHCADFVIQSTSDFGSGKSQIFKDSARMVCGLFVKTHTSMMAQDEGHRAKPQVPTACTRRIKCWQWLVS
jgi:hypothetical protein